MLHAEFEVHVSVGNGIVAACIRENSNLVLGLEHPPTPFKGGNSLNKNSNIRRCVS